MNPNEIRHFNGYNPSLEKPRDVLPVGGYICKIIKAKAQDLPDGNQELDLMLEIVEGAYTGFFHRDYDSQNRSYTPRYRGIYKVVCPTNNLRPEDAWRLDKFNFTLGAITASNPGYEWNWDASSLAGLSVGISVRENEYRGIIRTEIGKLIPVSTILNGNFRPMKRRISRETGYVQGYPAPTMAAPAPVSAPPVMVPRSGGYSLPQGQGPKVVQRFRFGPAGSVQSCTQTDDIPF